MAVITLVVTASLSFAAGYFLRAITSSDSSLFDPLPSFTRPVTKELPLLKYAIPTLAKQIKSENVNYPPLQVSKLLSSDPDTNLYTLLFTYQSRGQQISGALNLKLEPSDSTENATTASNQSLPVILMLRGFAPLEGYYSGMGTKNAAAVFARNNYLTLAPDFLGYGDSDPEPTDTWEVRFIKPLQVIDLLRTLEQHPIIDLSNIAETPVASITLDPARIGIWAHSNGGQIAVTTLQILGRNLPTTLWAPVLAPFPYSILYFSDENADEGKEARKWLSMFEADYDVFDFSLTRHLDRLQGPLQIHHGGRDDAALISWSQEFLDKVELENERRTDSKDASDSATASAILDESISLDPIEIDFHQYPNANHNLQPNWEQVVQRDLQFFGKWLGNPR